MRLRRGHRDSRFVHARHAQRRRANIVLDRHCLIRAKSGRVDTDCRDAVCDLTRADPRLVRQARKGVDGMVHAPHIGSVRRLATVFRLQCLYIRGR